MPSKFPWKLCRSIANVSGRIYEVYLSFKASSIEIIADSDSSLESIFSWSIYSLIKIKYVSHTAANSSGTPSILMGGALVSTSDVDVEASDISWTLRSLLHAKIKIMNGTITNNDRGVESK